MPTANEHAEQRREILERLAKRELSAEDAASRAARPRRRAEMATFVRTQEISHIIGTTGRLELRVSSADVQVRASEGNEVHVRGTFQIRAPSEDEANRIFDQIQLREERTSDTLRVTERDDRAGLVGTLGRIFGGGDHGGLDLEVELPTGAELRLDTVSGDVQASGLRGAQRYHTVSGDLFLTEIGGSVRVNTVSGDATVRGVRADGPACRGDLGRPEPGGATAQGAAGPRRSRATSGSRASSARPANSGRRQ